MLVYTSCETESPVDENEFSETVSELDLRQITRHLMEKREEIKAARINGSNAETLNRLQLEEKFLASYLERELKLKYLDLEPSFLNKSLGQNTEEKGISSVNTNKELVPLPDLDEVPIFPGCEDAENPKDCFREKMNAHVRKHFNYPQEAQNLGIEGRVSVLFTIDKNGNITDIRKRGPHELLEKEVVRIISRLPKMIPGSKDGEAVKCLFQCLLILY